MKSKKGATRPPSTPVESTGASVLCGASSPSIHGGEISNSQRDQIRSTIIINLGGSDSDASRATSAVNKSNASESSEGSPYASTSSGSYREQSSVLEESSVSTDSGLGSSGASFEVDETDSPPTDEGDPVEKESSNSIYRRHMYLEAHGFPLWIPQSNMRLSRSYRRQGVSIGDVGIFTSDGGFDFLFNVCLPAGHPNNPNELPEGFSCFVLRPADVSEFHAHSSHTYLASPSVKKREATFECSGSDGAILTMPQGAYHEDLKNIRRFREYALIYAESWYHYANGPCGREIGNGELHLVTGCDKATSWGIATYSHLQSNRPEDNVSTLRFNPVSNERQGRHSSYTAYKWDHEGAAAEAKFGPEEDELMNLGVHGSVPPRNQCTFIRSLTFAFSVDDWERLELKVESSVKNQASVQPPKSPFPSVTGTISSLTSRIGFLRGHGRGGSSEVTDSMIPAQTTVAHPTAYVIAMMLRKCPKAKVVVVHDSDWCSVIRDSDDDWAYTAQDLPRRIQEAFHIVEEKNGTVVYLEEKTRPSQHLSTSSDVSVKLEVEDLPLFEDRKRGLSQLFDSFEISPSDMQIDSPPIKEIVDNGDGDIKPNKCHDSDEDDDDLGKEGQPDQKAGPSQLSELSPFSNLKVDSPQTFKKLIDDWDDIKPHKYYDSDEDDEDQFGDEDNLELDAAFLEFILRRIQQVKNDASFEQSASSPRSLKGLVDDCDKKYSSDSGKARLGIDMVDEDSPWSDAFSEYISLQIQKLKSNSFYDNKFKMDHDPSWDPFKLDTNDLDNKHRIMLNAVIKIMLQRLKHKVSSFGVFPLPGYIKVSADDGHGGAIPDLFDVSGEADSSFLKGKFVPMDSKLHDQAPPDDEDYPMSDAALLDPTSQPHEREHSTSPPSLPQSVTSPSLANGPQRKGKRFAKEATDYLKAWLDRHSDFPYPSEDEKTLLCHATGLSRTQLSGWMVNARRRILAPAHRTVRGGEVVRIHDSRDAKRLKTKSDQFVEDLTVQPVPIEHRKEGCDWVVLHNPEVKKTLDIDLVHTFVHESVVRCVHFSADGRYLATGCNRTAQIFDTTTGEKVCVLAHDSIEKENLYIRCVRFSPDGKMLATGAEDPRVRIWDIAKARIQQVFDGHQHDVYSLDFSRDGRLIISGSGDNTIRIWDLYNKFHKVLTLSDNDDSQHSGVMSVTISPDATLVAAGTLDTIVRIWDVATGTLLQRLQGHKDSIYSVAFTSDGKGLVSGSLDKSVKYWDVSVLAAGRAKGKPENATPTPTSSGPSSSSDGLVPCTMDFVGHKNYVLSVSVTPDSRWVASGSKDRCVRFWDTRNACLQFELKGHKNSVCVDLSPKGALLATGSGDGLARTWNYTTV